MMKKSLYHWSKFLSLVLLAVSLAAAWKTRENKSASLKISHGTKVLESSLFSPKFLDDEIHVLEKNMGRGSSNAGQDMVTIGKNRLKISQWIIGSFVKNKIKIVSYNIGSRKKGETFTAEGKGTAENSLHLLYDLSFHEKGYHLTYIYIDNARISVGASYSPDYFNDNSTLISASKNNPVFNPEIALLFDQRVDPPELLKKTETRKITKEVMPLPFLKLVGIVETTRGKLYSIKNIQNNNLLLLEKGVETGGITLLKEENGIITLKVKKDIFKIGKK